jgi:hypothetical protein
MDTAQHAGNILEAWRFRDLSRFNAALHEAFRACMGGIPVSRLEAEREEILQSVVEHLRGYNGSQQLENFSSCAAVTLLRHLSAGRNEKENSHSVTKNSSRTLKFCLKMSEMVYRKSNAAREAEPATGRIRTIHDISSN